MPDTRPYTIADVFTDRPFAGNPLAIVEEADGLSDQQMLTLAREFNLSETIFVQTPNDPGHDAKVRIWFPTAEIPFAGHPTIGCALLLAARRMGATDSACRIYLEEVAGLVPVEVWREGSDLVGELTAPVVPHAPDAGSPPDAAMAAQALGLSPDDIGFGGHRIHIWQGGPRFLFVPVRDLAVLARARPCEPGWSAMLDHAAVDNAYVYTPGDASDYQARMFSPTAGIPEDPATGSASALLAAQLLAAGKIADGETRLALRQGVEMGRPSDIGLRVVARDGALQSVHIAGRACKVAEGRVALPPA